MKKLISLLLFTSIILLTSCTNTNLTAKDAVRSYFDSYITLDSTITEQLDDYVNNEELTPSQKEIYKEILKKQYSSLNYKITNETYEEDIAYITTKITVLDYLKVQNEASSYLRQNYQEFSNDEGTYDRSKFLDYKLDKMQSVTDTIEYEIEFKIVKEQNKWHVTQLSKDDLQKIHGIYEN